MKFIASANRITFHHEGKTTTIKRENNAYFDKVLDGIRNGRDNLLDLFPNYITNPSAIADQTNGDIYWDGHSFNSDQFYFPKSLNSVLTELVDKDLPILPLTKLCQKLSHLSKGLSEKVGSFVAEGDVPLSWDGNLITYARSSWIANNYELEDWMDRGFIPHETRTGDNLITGSFNWATKNCPDQGRVFDLLVQPQHIINVEDRVFKSTQVTNISTLEETSSPESRVQLIQTETNALGETVYIRSPFSQGQLSHYISSSLDKNTHIPEEVKVSV